MSGAAQCPSSPGSQVLTCTFGGSVSAPSGRKNKLHLYKVAICFFLSPLLNADLCTKPCSWS